MFAVGDGGVSVVGVQVPRLEWMDEEREGPASECCASPERQRGRSADQKDSVEMAAPLTRPSRERPAVPVAMVGTS